MFKKYASGAEFLAENQPILDANPLSTCFIRGNAAGIDKCSEDQYIFQFFEDKESLIALCLKPWSLLLHGSPALCGEAARVLAAHNLTFSGVQAELPLAGEFLEEYEKLCGGTHQIKLSMDIMYAEAVRQQDISGVRRCTVDDLMEVAELSIGFMRDALQEEKTTEEMIAAIKDCIGDFYCIKDHGKIVSIAKMVRIEEKMAGLSYVYTKRDFRNRGFSRKVVACVTKAILDANKIPYLFVDKTNPVSNHLYTAIGYVYDSPKYEVEYRSAPVEDAQF